MARQDLLREHTETIRGHGFVAADVPRAVDRGDRDSSREGIGRWLLTELTAPALRSGPALSLSVDHENAGDRSTIFALRWTSASCKRESGSTMVRHAHPSNWSHELSSGA